MLCARVMRGISSIENSVAPVAASVADRLRSAERIGEADDRLSGSQRAESPGVARTWSTMSDGLEDLRARDDGCALRPIRVVR